MNFNSYIFIFAFLPLCLACYRIVASLHIGNDKNKALSIFPSAAITLTSDAGNATETNWRIWCSRAAICEGSCPEQPGARCIAKNCRPRDRSDRNKDNYGAKFAQLSCEKFFAAAIHACRRYNGYRTVQPLHAKPDAKKRRSWFSSIRHTCTEMINRDCCPFIFETVVLIPHALYGQYPTIGTNSFPPD